MLEHTLFPEKMCTGCFDILPADREYYSLDSQKCDDLCSRCKDCHRTYYKKNRTKRLDYTHAHYQVARTAIIKHQQEYYQSTRDRRLIYALEYRQKNCKLLQEKRHREYMANPQQYLVKNRAYRSRKHNAEGTHTTADMRRQYDVQKGNCWWCGIAVAWEDKHDDHLIPLARGGTNWANNMVVSCMHCNESKGAKLPHEWNGRLF